MRIRDPYTLRKPLHEKHVHSTKDMFDLILGNYDMGYWVVHYLSEENEYP